jgi:hypothetical protein
LRGSERRPEYAREDDWRGKGTHRRVAPPDSARQMAQCDEGPSMYEMEGPSPGLRGESGPISQAHFSPLGLHRASDHLKRRLPNASAAVSRPREVSPAVPIPPRRPSVSVTSAFYSRRASPARGSTDVFKISDVSTAPSTESDGLSPEFTIFFTGCPHPGTRSDSEMAHAAAAAQLSMMPTHRDHRPDETAVDVRGW